MLKLMVAEREAREKLNKENLTMGNEIRAEFSTIDSRIRAEHKEATDALLINFQTSNNSIKERF